MEADTQEFLDVEVAREEFWDGEVAREKVPTAKTPDVPKIDWLKQQKAQLKDYKRGGSLRNKPRISYTEEEEPNDDNYFLCEDCEDVFIEECWIHGPPIFIPDTPAPVGVPDRARLTLPPGLEVSRSHIPNAGLGVFNRGQEIARGTHFGPYEGEVMYKDQAMESGYSWVIFKGLHRDECIDAKRETHSNWMRYVNCARDHEEQNLVAFQYRGGIVYRCCRPIGPGEELLVWYGEDYAKELGITLDYLWDVNTQGTKEVSQVHKHVKRSPTDEYVHLLRSGEIRSDVLPSGDRNRHKHQSTIEASRPVTQSSSEQQGTDDQKQNRISRIGGKTQHRTHTGERPYQCSQCGKRFIQVKTLKEHQRIHTGERPYHCTQCGKTFNKAFNLKLHQYTHTGERPYHCTQCGKNFTQAGALKVHQRTHTGERPYHCIQCGGTFTQCRSLKTHKCSHSKEPLTHTGRKKHSCSQCGKSFIQAGTLKVHQRTHTGERPYQCTMCGKSFNTAFNLKQHQYTHTGERPYHCTQCGKGFTQTGALKIHQRTHTGARPYDCTWCGKSCITKGNLKLHQYTHTGERPYPCTQCGKSFTQAEHLRRHQRTHTGERPYHCTPCGKSFNTAFILKRHQRIHTRERPYNCTQCGKKFTQAGALKVH